MFQKRSQLLYLNKNNFVDPPTKLLASVKQEMLSYIIIIIYKTFLSLTLFLKIFLLLLCCYLGI